MSNPVVAIVGRPNVGKSTLFNRLVEKRLSIVDDTSGVTRDRIISECEWRGKKISVVDTGGMDFSNEENLISGVVRQTYEAIGSADVIIFVTNLKDGIISSDEEVASVLKKSGKPVVLCVNKCDRLGEPEAGFYEFYKLGLGDPIEVSSIHGHGTGDLLDKVFDNLSNWDVDENDQEVLNVAIIGKPNVGKSSLVNRMLGFDRCLVSNLAGTTRDSVDAQIANEFGKYNFIDTAGLRKSGRIFNAVEKYSVIRSKISVKRSDVCVIMIDASEGITDQDTKIAGLAHEEGKGCIIVFNKWDIVEKDSKTMSKYKEDVKNKFKFMSYAPTAFISAKTGQRTDTLFGLINFVSESCSRRISTGSLNDILSEAMARVQPPTDKGKRLKIYYITQVGIKPPTFVFFVNKEELFHFSYQRYIENFIRKTFGLEGTPIRFVIREKSEKKFFRNSKER